MSSFLVILIFLLNLQIIAYILFKNTYYCDNLKSLISLNYNSNIKYKYFPLEKSNLYKSTSKILNSSKIPLDASSNYIKDKNFLLTLTKFIDYKINNNKQFYRAKQDVTIIENCAHVIAKNIHIPNNYKLFHIYKQNYKNLQIKQKENKIFKILLAKHLIIEANNILDELNQISRVIQKYKKRKFILNYKKSILQNAKIYSILKFNPNSTYITQKHKFNTNNVLKSFFYELFDSENKLKTIMTYLKVMFDF